MRSLLAQTLKEFEIVAVNDGSDDGSVELLQSWSAKDARLRVQSGPHDGLIAALNTGLELCRSPLVARMDAADTVHPRRLEKQSQMFADRPELNVVGSLVETVPRQEVGEGLLIYEQWLNSLVDHADITREIFIESPIAHPSAMVRREEILKLGGYRECGWPEDYDLWLRVLPSRQPVCEGQ